MSNQDVLGPPKMSARDFDRLAEFIHSEYGIKMPPIKKTMLESRLHKRLRKLRMTDFSEYIDYVLEGEGRKQEIVLMIDQVTTNKTDFFREPGHFEYLVNTALPQLARLAQIGLRTPLRVWSAGCSTGEEPYTLAIVLSEFGERHPSYRFSIVATDISSGVLEKAQQAVYEESTIAPIPIGLRKKYLLRSKDRSSSLVRIGPGPRGHIQFQRLNLMDDRYPLEHPMDLIFLRNVIIYFDKQTQAQLINRVCRHLKSGGYLFLGHSETLFSLDVPLTQIAPTIYLRK